MPGSNLGFRQDANTLFHLKTGSTAHIVLGVPLGPEVSQFLISGFYSHQNASAVEEHRGGANVV